MDMNVKDGLPCRLASNRTSSAYQHFQFNPPAEVAHSVEQNHHNHPDLLDHTLFHTSPSQHAGLVEHPRHAPKVVQLDYTPERYPRQVSFLRTA